MARHFRTPSFQGKSKVLKRAFSILVHVLHIMRHELHLAEMQAADSSG
jgi:hypothetical protein